MPNKANKGPRAIHHLMQDLMLLQQREGRLNEENESRYERRDEKSMHRRYYDDLSLSEQIEYYQQKLNSLRRAERLDALLSHPNPVIDFDLRELITATDSLKTTLMGVEQKVRNEPHCSEDNTSLVREELDQIRTTLGVLMENIGRVTEMVSISNEYLKEYSKKALSESKSLTSESQRGFPSTQITADLDAIKNEHWAEVKKEKLGLPVTPALAEQEDIGEEDSSEFSKLISEQEKRITRENFYSEENEARLEKVGELQKHIQKASQMIEKRADLVRVKRGEEQSQSSDQDLQRKRPSVSFSKPAEIRKIQQSNTGDKGIEQAIESLKSKLNPLERLSLEQYLKDLYAFDTQNRLFAVKKLGKMCRKELTGLLLDAWEKETENSVRAEILSALADINYDEVATVLKNALKRSDPKVVLAALEGLYRFGGKEAEEEFVKALDHPHYSVRRRAGTYLGWLEAEWAIPNLVKLLRDPDIYNRKVGVSILSKFKIKQVIFFFIEALNDPDQGVRQTVIKVLSNWTGQDLGYDPQADEVERSEAVQAWRQWWNNSDAEGVQFKAKEKTKDERAPNKQDDSIKEKILAVLKKQERGLSLKEIGEKMGTAWQGLTTLVNQLCQENLLIKEGGLYFPSQE